ncbi:polyphosphate kinase 2 [Solicola gregarius]|uniref:ADP/GDP-polyphosphate phosphotransferase n=1 Tax=Solicola gregarius TaxID=2908642 RepID=A0AA46YNL9_9ACTN|nr:polyphosphate kinase 2 [Solicola gregarius]UYM07616.1 polyphosphate kinase 2 [Solicola gregarius]
MNHADQPPSSGDLVHPPKLKGSTYRRELHDLQVELVKLQSSLSERGERVLVIFEGRDTAGKGGTIRRFRRHTNPRNVSHVALAKPNDTERSEWYFQRYIAHLPAAGELVLYDRSWYNRAGVEHVMGFCTPEEYSLFLRQAPELERSLIESGIHLFKLWLAVNHDEQARRLESRHTDPLKKWKLSSLDRYAQDRWDDYTEAMEAMFRFTDTPEAPWWVVNTNDKRTGRVNAMRLVLSGLEYADKDPDVARPPDPALVSRPADAFPADGGPTA